MSLISNALLAVGGSVLLLTVGFLLDGYGLDWDGVMIGLGLIVAGAWMKEVISQHDQDS